jgi:predicted MFS family arabinose efflux permease
MFGPLVAPFIGAEVGPTLGWRSTFWMLVIMGGVAEVAALALYR